MEWRHNGYAREGLLLVTDDQDYWGVRMYSKPATTLAFICLILICLFPTVGGAQEIDCLPSSENEITLTPADVLSDLERVGFVVVTPNGNKYNFDAISDYSSDQIRNGLRAIESVNVRNSALLFYLNTAGTILTEKLQAKCFIKSEFIGNSEKLKLQLKLLNNFILKRPQSVYLLNSLLAIAKEMNHEQTLAYLRAIGAVYFTAGGMGVGVNAAEARFDKRKAAHLPNEIMAVLASNLKKGTPAHRSIIYQVEHMGHDQGMRR